MQHYETIWQFETPRFTVTCDVTPEDMDPAESLEEQEDIDAIRDGAVDWFVARVRVLLDGKVIAADYLGGCAYRNASDFVSGADRDGYFRDMVRSAVSEARRNLASSPRLRA
jgi:hypothetical protein